MANKNRKNLEIDCTCLDLYENVKKKYYFNDCSIIKKCIKNGILKECDSVCIYGKENCGKTLLLTEILVDLTAVKELRGLNCKAVYLDCDLSFNYKNYENILDNKFVKYIGNCSTNSVDKCKNINLRKYFLDNSFSNIYYIPIFNPGHLLVILNTLKNLLEKKILIEALIIDSLSFWNFCKYDKINFFSDSNFIKRNSSDLLDYAFTLILNLKKKFKFLFFYTKLSNEDKFIEYSINFSINDKFNGQMDKFKAHENMNFNQSYISRSNNLKQAFLIPQNFNDILKIHIFRKKDFITNNFLIEKPFLIFLIPNEKKKFTHINKKNDMNNLNFLLCLSSEMKSMEKTYYSKFFFMIINSHTIVPL